MIPFLGKRKKRKGLGVESIDNHDLFYIIMQKESELKKLKVRPIEDLLMKEEMIKNKKREIKLYNNILKNNIHPEEESGLSLPNKKRRIKTLVSIIIIAILSFICGMLFLSMFTQKTSII